MMAGVTNPYFDPDWQSKSRLAGRECAAWETLCGEIAAAEGFGSARHLAAMERHRQAKLRARAAQLAQFATVADYAAWRFNNLPAAKDSLAIVPDFAAFTSIEDVEAAVARAAQHRREGSLADKILLPVRQPIGLRAFADPDELISSWRRFEVFEANDQLAGKTDDALECIVSFCPLQGGAEFHFCLAHRWGGLSPRANEQFTSMATVLTRQAIAFSIPGAEIIFHDGRHRLAEHLALIRQVNEMAKRFRFYRHLWPDHRLKEQFSRVDMLWDGARFIEPDWSAEIYPSLPAALRKASENFPATQASQLALPRS